MPSPNIIKTYVDNSYYHIYNRGVEKRLIFQDEKDYKVFLSYLQFYLTDPLRGETSKSFPSQQLHNHMQQIKLLAYCLMPNHFHLFIKQNDRQAINHFMRSLATRYGMYFNKRYNRIGSLFQGPYKAVLIDEEMQYLYLSKYLHRNPLDLSDYTISNLLEYPYSSYRNYLGIINQNWIHSQEIKEYFSKENHHTSYKEFIEDNQISEEISTLKNMTLDHNT
ncbi:MAG: transposase [bacterium]